MYRTTLMQAMWRTALAVLLTGSLGGMQAVHAGDDLNKKVVDYFRWKNKLPSDVTAQLKDVKDSDIKGVKTGTLALSRGEQSQDLEVLISEDGKWAIFNATKGELKESKVKGAKEAEVNLGRPVQILIPEGGNQVIIGSMEDISIDVAAEIKKEKDAEAKKAEEALKKLSAEGQPVRGNKKAKVTIVEFSDFQCPFCSRAHDTLVNVTKEYGDKVRVVYKNFPLNFHNWAEPAAIAGECVFDQDEEAFWKVYDHLFAKQKDIKLENVKDQVLEAIKGTKVDVAKFNECYDGKKTKERVDKDMQDGQAVGVSGTPAFFINGRMISGAQPPEKFKELIDDALKGGKS